jgi:hypothetical protein
MTRRRALKALAVDFENANRQSPRIGSEAGRAEEPRAEFRADSKHARRFRILGWVMIVLGVLRFVVQDTVTLDGLIGVLFLLLARWLRHQPIATVYIDRVDFKPRWLSFRRSIHARDIRDLVIETKAAFVVLDDGRRIRVPLSQLHADERNRLLYMLQDLRARFS